MTLFCVTRHAMTVAGAVGLIMVAASHAGAQQGTAATHSDLSAGTTPLAQRLGMPAEASWPKGIVSFHDVGVHGYYTYWYDASRRLTVIEYACASSFVDGSGATHNNFPTLDASLMQMIRNVHVRDRATPAG